MASGRSLLYLAACILAAATVGAVRFDSSFVQSFTVVHSSVLDDERPESVLVIRGIVEGFFGAAMPDLETCVKDTEKVAQDADFVARAFADGAPANDMRTLLSQFASALEASLRPCVETKAEYQTLVQALVELQHPLAFTFEAGKYLVVNHVAIFDEIRDASNDWQQKDFEGFGREAGKALALLLDGLGRREMARPAFTEWAIKHGQPYASAATAGKWASPPRNGTDDDDDDSDSDHQGGHHRGDDDPGDGGRGDGHPSDVAAGASTSEEKRAKLMAEEFELRLSIFSSNLKVADELTAADLGTATYGASPFAAMTLEEFASTRLMKPFRMKDGDLAKSCLENGAISPPPPDLTSAGGTAPDSWNWNEKGVVTPVRDQASCGSCWAFSTAENIESLWALAHHNLTVLSPQEIVDCSHGCSPEGAFGNVCNSGCMGGWPWTAYTDIIRQGGLASEDAYPYKAVDGTCAFQGKAEASATITNYTCLPSDENAIRDYLVSHGPLSVALDARFLMLYTGGVSSPPMCSQEELDHAVLLVGYGTETPTKGKSTDELPFWYIKNSWTLQWGEAGYFRLAKGGNVCGIANAASSAILTIPLSPLTPSGHGGRPHQSVAPSSVPAGRESAAGKVAAAFEKLGRGVSGFWSAVHPSKASKASASAE